MSPLFAALAAVVGFAIQKGGLCAVLAVREAMDERRFRRFLAFFVCVAVVVVITTPLRWAGGLPAEPAPHYRLAGIGLAGAVLFGIGAVINGTCAFGSIAHIGRGEISFLALLPGLAAGFLAADRLPPAVLPLPLGEPHVLASPTPSGLAIVGVSGAAVLASAVWLWRQRQPRLDCRQRLRSLLRQRWPASAAAALAGLAAGLLYGTVGAWAYTEGLHRALNSMLVDPRQAILSDVGLFVALLAGSAIAAASERNLSLRRPTSRQVLRSLFGGALMGVGAVLVPGGNDALVLQAMPDLATHGWVSYATMVAAIFLSLATARRMAGQRRRC